MPRITLRHDQPFSLDQTLGCGQVFRWEHMPDGSWTGVVGGRVIRCRQNGLTLSFTGAGEPFIRHYFSLDLDLPAILESIDRDPFIHEAIEQCRGLRLVRQAPWECLCSYICATNTNIPAVRRRVATLAEQFGERIEEKDTPSFSFPDPIRIACTGTASSLRECRLGYRMPYVFKSACDAAAQTTWTDALAVLPYEEARHEMMKFAGIGPKAADCVLLFAFQKYEAFPVDVWIRRIMREHYLPALPQDTTLTGKEYNAIRTFARKRFGAYCGIAQEYIYAAREGSKR
ncbi:DNA-3-methyladenine glycosylase family protein [Methanoregula sp.]|uniref:DNA-3-methyladenine glycosylase family protein n=1 Tax=Methanoregula sp. TaxID=2052170 RepID=UPI002BF3D7C5|nr:DNA glycosylase [Methanoregula sp.]HVP96232.1 DNA glycosylase [Methanoregula sp.]